MSYSSEVLADTPLGYWRLGDASGTTMTDSSGNSRSGTYTGSPTLGVAGLLTGDSDTAVSFAAGPQYGGVTFGSWMSSSNMTVECLAKPTTVSGNQYMMCRDASGSRVWGFTINAGKLNFYWAIGGSVFTTAGATTLTVGTVYHLAATFNGTAGIVYVNGASDGSSTHAGTMNVASQNLYVGYNLQFSVGQFPGTLDECAFYGSALSSTRIAAHYTAATGGGGGSSPRGVFREPAPLRRQAVIRASSY